MGNLPPFLKGKRQATLKFPPTLSAKTKQQKKKNSRLSLIFSYEPKIKPFSFFPQLGSRQSPFRLTPNAYSLSLAFVQNLRWTKTPKGQISRPLSLKTSPKLLSKALGSPSPFSPSPLLYRKKSPHFLLSQASVYGKRQQVGMGVSPG